MNIRRRLDDYGTHTLPQRHAERTNIAYKGAGKRWLEFCADCAYHWKDWTPTTSFQFVCWRRTIGGNMKNGNPVTAATIASQISGIQAWLINRGVANVRGYNQYSMPRTSALLAAIARHEKPGYKRPLTGAQLRRMFACLPTSTYDALVFSWVVALIHNTMRRVDEVMPTLTRALVAGDITWSNGTFRPRLEPPYDATASYAFRHSKRNQQGLLQTAFMWCRCAHTVCALCRLRELYRRCPWEITPRTPLLLLVTGKVLDYAATMKVLKELCRRCGYNPNDYGTHSLRRGGLHDAQDEGQSDALINSQAYWRNNRSRRPYERTRETIDAAKKKEIAAMSAPKKDSRKRPKIAGGKKSGKKAGSAPKRKSGSRKQRRPKCTMPGIVPLRTNRYRRRR